MHKRSAWQRTGLAALVTAVAAGAALGQGTSGGTGGAAGNGSAGGPVGVHGVWIDDTGQGAVEIGPCGDRLCGRVVWLREGLAKGGQPVVDSNNPDPVRRKRPVCGLPVIGDLVRQRDGSWDQGWIYDPKVGKSYDVELRLNGPDRLRVTGYLGMKLLSESFVWTRAPMPLEKCRAAGQAL